MVAGRGVDVPKAVVLALFACLLAGALPAPARATLGKSASSISSNRRSLGAGAATIFRQTPAYSVEQFTTSSGTVVREYVSASNVVFAVSWHGPIPPNLSVLLGSYFNQYKATAASQNGPAIQRPKSLKSQDLVVQTGGHMRDLRGRAYVSSLLPAGMSVEEIR